MVTFAGRWITRTTGSRTRSATTRIGLGVVSTSGSSTTNVRAFEATRGGTSTSTALATSADSATRIKLSPGSFIYMGAMHQERLTLEPWIGDTTDELECALYPTARIAGRDWFRCSTFPRGTAR